MAHIEMIPPEKAEGKLKEIYGDIIKKRGMVAEVLQIQSLNPDSLSDHLSSYMTIMFKKSPLSRAQREMMAVVVSSLNGCHYCQTHHSEALNFFWKDQVKVEQLKSFSSELSLSEIDRTLVEYAKGLTKHPGKNHLDTINCLKALGLSDRAVLDATLVIGYFNFVNRMVQGLGVELGSENHAKYKHD